MDRERTQEDRSGHQSHAGSPTGAEGPSALLIPDRFQVVDEVDYVGSYHQHDLGDGQKMVMVHMDVWYFSPSVLKKMKKQWAVFRKSMRCPLFAMGETDDAKFERYVSLFGFQYLTNIPCTDGKVRRLFVNYP